MPAMDEQTRHTSSSPVFAEQKKILLGDAKNKRGFQHGTRQPAFNCNEHQNGQK
jgi:hypothetical protein